MANAFDSANYPTSEPAELAVGDRWAWKRSDLGSDYPPASYALSYALRRHGAGNTAITITASESGSDYVVEVASTTTAAYESGTYAWQAYITRSSDSERVVVDKGTVRIVPNRVTATDDPRTPAKRMLDAIDAMLEGTASSDVASYTIQTGNGSRSISRMSRDELIRWQRYYEHRVANEIARERAAAGIPSGGLIRARFL